MLWSYALKHLHGELVVVRRGICAGEHGRKLILARRYLLMLRFCKHAKLPQLPVKLRHKRLYPCVQRAEVVIVQLLALGRFGAEKRPSAQHKVASFCPKLLINKKVFLLRADRRVYPFYIFPAHRAHEPQRLAAYKLHRAQKRRFFIQRIPVV